MELGELITVPLPDQSEDAKCPFSHDPPKAEEKNELGGIGTTLASNMEKGEGICHSSRADGSYRTGDVVLDPRKRPGREAVKRVTITVNGEEVRLSPGSDPLPYPVTCAAHHLVPAQEALKGHEILKYMCKKGEPQDFRKGKRADAKAVPGSKVWGNVAYNVNGCHNGVWLPGNYAVGGGTGGAAVWAEKATARRKDQQANQNWVDALDLAPDAWDTGDDDFEEEASDALNRALGGAKKKAFMLAGRNHQIAEGNPKWAYVVAAMDATGAQFHDRHEDYSKQVQLYLAKIAGAYKDRHATSKKSCKKCDEASRPKGMTASELGPPFAIVSRMKTAAGFFRKYLLATKGVLGAKRGKRKTVVTAENIFTSGWVKAWFDSETE